MVRIDPDPENGLNKPSAADAFQIRSVAQERFMRKIGRVSDPALGKILEAIQVVIGAYQIAYGI
jgi:mRNA interferase MazF